MYTYACHSVVWFSEAETSVGSIKVFSFFLDVCWMQTLAYTGTDSFPSLYMCMYLYVDRKKAGLSPGYFYS